MQGQTDRQRFYYYELERVLDHGTHLYLEMPTEIAVLIDGNTEPPTLLAAQQFTPAEWDLLRVLLDNHPDYASHASLYAAFKFMPLERARQMLNDADDDKTWDDTMRGVRSVISRIRIKLQPFGINPVSLVHTGYVLTPRTRL